MREKSFKNEINENISYKSMTSRQRLSNIVLLSIERVRAEKIDLDDFVDDFGSRHDRIKLQ